MDSCLGEDLAQGSYSAAAVVGFAHGEDRLGMNSFLAENLFGENRVFECVGRFILNYNSVFGHTKIDKSIASDVSQKFGGFKIGCAHFAVDNNKWCESLMINFCDLFPIAAG